MAKKKKPGVPHQQEQKSTDRTWVTLPAFTLFELNQLEGIYAPTVPEVIKQIVQAWLHDNQAQIEQRKARHREFLASRGATE